MKTGLVRVLFGLCVMLAALPALAQERITRFDATLTLEHNGDLLVREEIAVLAENKQINHGIYRELSTLVPQTFGLLRAPFEVVEVTRDGQSEAWRLKPHGQNLRIYMGSEGVTLPPGRHIYTLTYRMGWQVRRFPDYDELYWNVTGNGWSFPIDDAQVTLYLPAGGRFDQYSAYAGKSGATGVEGQDYRLDLRGTQLTAQTLRPLSGREGLTIAAGFQKGLIPQPDGAAWLELLRQSNTALLICAAGLTVLLLYYSFGWASVGRDPGPGPITPTHRPAYSPAAMRYVRNMGYDRKTLSAALLSLAGKGYLRLEERTAGGPDMDKTRHHDLAAKILDLMPKTYAVVEEQGGKDATADEQRLLQLLFAGRRELSLTRANRSAVVGINRAFEKYLVQSFNLLYFRRNLKWFGIGFLISLATWVLAAVQQGGEVMALSLFMSVWLSFWTLGTGLLLFAVFQSWAAVLRGSFWSLGPALFLTLFALPFVAGWVSGAYMLMQAVGIAGALFLLLLIGVNLLFLYLLRAPTLQGRKLLDEIEGLKQYMNAQLSPAGERVQAARFLPYAVALDMEKAWGDRLGGALGAAAESSVHSNLPYRYGAAHLGTATGLAVASSLTSALAAATAASRSGAGGGGSSGGGGGGAGGGGW